MFNKNKNTTTQKEVSNMQINTVISEGITVVGDLNGAGAVRVDGKMEGNIELSKAVIVGEKAEVTGKIKSSVVMIYGKLTGDLECRDLYIMKSGVIDGNMKVNRFSVEMGGKYNGNLKMTDNEVNFQEKISQKQKVAES